MLNFTFLVKLCKFFNTRISVKRYFSTACLHWKWAAMVFLLITCMPFLSRIFFYGSFVLYGIKVLSICPWISTKQSNLLASLKPCPASVEFVLSHRWCPDPWVCCSWWAKWQCFLLWLCWSPLSVLHQPVWEYIHQSRHSSKNGVDPSSGFNLIFSIFYASSAGCQKAIRRL